jgi:hypothetical protein
VKKFFAAFFRERTLASLSPGFLRQLHVLPLERAAAGLGLAMANPIDDYAADAIAMVVDGPNIQFG